MYTLRLTKSFRRHFKKFEKNQKQVTEIQKFLELLKKGNQLPQKYQEHKLKGYFSEFFEAHIFPDLLCIYRKFPKEKIIVLRDIGSHDDLFG